MLASGQKFQNLVTNKNIFPGKAYNEGSKKINFMFSQCPW